ncbi:MAG: DUF1326 domain-containing protein [Bryobacteraceae bacterium]|jgi:hypothetical protein
MRNSVYVFLCALLAVPLLSGAGLTKSNLRGAYIEARNADVYTGPCFANGEAGQVGDLAVLGWRIEQGSWEGVPLDGLSVVGIVRAGNTLGAGISIYPVRSVLIVDQRANPEQRAALRSLARRMGGELLEDVVRVEYAPVSLTIKNNSVHTATATLEAGALARIETRALRSSDDICHNEETFYPPLTHVDHAMPAFTVADRFDGQGLGETWSAPDKRSAFVGSFHYAD